MCTIMEYSIIFFLDIQCNALYAQIHDKVLFIVCELHFSFLCSNSNFLCIRFSFFFSTCSIQVQYNSVVDRFALDHTAMKVLTT